MGKLLNEEALAIYNSHTHSQGIDNDANTQQDTNAPNEQMAVDTDTTTDTIAS